MEKKRMKSEWYTISWCCRVYLPVCMGDAMQGVKVRCSNQIRCGCCSRIICLLISNSFYIFPPLCPSNHPSSPMIPFRPTLTLNHFDFVAFLSSVPLFPPPWNILIPNSNRNVFIPRSSAYGFAFDSWWCWCWWCRVMDVAVWGWKKWNATQRNATQQ